MKITVLSTFDVWPAIDGGQTRYVSLWTRFSPTSQITILAYDFRNTMSERRYRLTPNVEVLVPRAAEGDARLFYQRMSQTGLWLHDVLSIAESTLSAEFVTALRLQLEDCDALVASHPYLANLAFNLASARTLKVYEAHNVELDIKRSYFETAPGARKLLSGYLRQVKQVERLAVQLADHVTAVSAVERSRMHELYDVLPGKTSVLPNGVHARYAPTLDDRARAALRDKLGVSGRQVGVIVASSYAPNVEQYRITRLMLDEIGFTGAIILIGVIGHALRPEWPDVCFEEIVAGFVSNELKSTLLECADFAPHFVFEGAGTDLKLLDYMGHGVAVVANRFGVRGTTGDDWYWAAEDAAQLQVALAAMAGLPELARARAERGRAVAIAQFDWAALAAKFEARLRQGFPVATASTATVEQAQSPFI